MFTINGKYTTATVMIDSIDETTMAQIVKMVNHPAFTNPIKIMPDCHAGAGSVIGFTMPIGDKIIPNVVGVDGSCGMLSFEIAINDYIYENDRETLDKLIRSEVPFGTYVNDDAYNIEDRLNYVNMQKQAFLITEHLNGKLGMDVKAPKYDYDYFVDMCNRVGITLDYALRSIGTCGGGNHFCEIGKSKETGNIWITIHTGSRNLGKKVCDYWQKIAKDGRDDTKVIFDTRLNMLKLAYKGKELGKEIQTLRTSLNKNITVKSTGLEFLEGKDMYEYFYDMIMVQSYATLNRREIADKIISILRIDKDDLDVLDYIETIHNYINFSDFIIRKGAIASYKNERCAIPFNMEDGVLICEGKSNAEWNYSAPHGAGRVLSRTKAKEVINLDSAKESMKAKNIYSSNVPIDEVKGAYKDSAIIEKAIEPTVDILDRIIPIHNIKDDKNDEPPWRKKK